MLSSDLTPDLCIIGAGSAGLSIAAGAVQMGATVVLIERGEMGGDCLNYGCIPSKALLAAGKQADTLRNGSKFGIAGVEPEVDFKAVMAHVHGVIARIAPLDSQERFERLGIHVVREEARFKDKNTVVAGNHVIRPRRIVIATGSGPVAPPIPGLADVPYHTNETIFHNEVLPSKLIIIGGGPIGIEMAQAHRRLGADVVVLEGSKALTHDDPDHVAVVMSQLRSEGIEIKEEATVEAIAMRGEDYIVIFNGGEQVTGSHLLVAAGRAPNLDRLDLEAGGVERNRRGIVVNKRLRSTSNRRVYAAGDAAGKLQFTHVAGYHAGIIIQNVLFRLPASAKHDAIPWVTYCDPELAQVGLTESQARAQYGDTIRVLHWDFTENDRAQLERRTDGLMKIMTAKNGRILGASIVGQGAGEMIGAWAMIISQKSKIGSIAQSVFPYPTRSEASKRAAGTYYTPKLFSESTRWIVKLLSNLG
jgi:pyruvate/2-oxoglutarate dehydrogenase complex dihydrolipoamide dehydrogenase (E3) component